MSVKIKVDINTRKIMSKLGLDEKGKAEKFMASEVKRLSDPYVPLDKGNLKNTAVVRGRTVVYVQLYSKKQYYENRGKGQRGKKWEKRMLAHRKDELLKGVNSFIGRGRK